MVYDNTRNNTGGYDLMNISFFRKKVLNDKIEVSIVLDLKWVDISEDFN